MSSEAPGGAINADLGRRAAVDTATVDWQPSPGGHVLRKRVHLVGPAESGQVTSLVRYAPESRFPLHDHPDGEEILVLEGVFSDQRGDWPAGSYLLNPTGFSHAPYSREGCLLFVKLRQYPGPDRLQLAVKTAVLQWQPSGEHGVAIKPLYAQPGYRERVQLERWSPGCVVERVFSEGAELFVIDGEFAEPEDRHRRYGWLRLPRGGLLTATSRDGCTVYVKAGGLAYLRSG